MPPSPNVRAGWPNVAVDAVSSAAPSHGAIAGAFQPGPLSPSRERTRARRTAGRRRATALDGRDGGRSDRTSAAGGTTASSDVLGRSTLPARPTAGSPSAPMTLSVGRQVRDRSCSAGSSVVGPAPSTNGILVGDARRSRRPCRRASRDPVAGISTCSSGHEDRAGRRVLDAVEQHAGDPERRRHHARHVAGVQAFGDDVDRRACPTTSPRSDVVTHSRS